MHFNIQINIQQVGYRTVPRTTGRGPAASDRQRTVVEVLSLKVTAGTEKDAYAKAAAMLAAATPDQDSEPLEGQPEGEDEDDF